MIFGDFFSKDKTVCSEIFRDKQGARSTKWFYDTESNRCSLLSVAGLNSAKHTFESKKSCEEECKFKEFCRIKFLRFFLCFF